MKKAILEVLGEFEKISQVRDISNRKEYKNKKYEFIFEFNYSILNLSIPIILGVPYNRDNKLMDFYIKEYQDFTYIPHVGKNGCICLYDIEGVLIGNDSIGILAQLINRMDSILLNGIQGNNTEDFVEEFQNYWGLLPKVKRLKSFVKITKESKTIKYSDDKKIVKKKKKDRYIDVLQKQDMYELFASDTGSEFDIYKKVSLVKKDVHIYKVDSVKNGVYIYIETNDFILPPDWRKGLKHKFIDELINHPSLLRSEIIKCLNKCTRQILIMFGIKQPNNTINTFGVLVNNFSFSVNADDEITISQSSELIPCSVVRCDREFLLYRGSIYRNKDLKLLVIGCGSIGGYLVNELVKTGFTQIVIVDTDTLKEENIYRHLLGMEYVNQYKSKALSEFIEKNFTDVEIIPYCDSIEELIDEESISFEEFDIIISAVGDHNVNRWINQYVHDNQINKPVMYLWNEVMGIGNHVAIISNDKDCCYECFFSEDEEMGIYDRTSYCEKGQSFTRRVQGCGSSFLPYSSVNSITVVVAGIKTIINFINGKILDNCLISIKGDEYYFIEAGYTPSTKFYAQKEKEMVFEGKKIKNDSCTCCKRLKRS